jgi:hypothetical protein
MVWPSCINGLTILNQLYDFAKGLAWHLTEWMVCHCRNELATLNERFGLLNEHNDLTKWMVWSCWMNGSFLLTDCFGVCDKRFGLVKWMVWPYKWFDYNFDCLILSYSSKIDGYLYPQRVSPPLKKCSDMSPKGSKGTDFQANTRPGIFLKSQCHHKILEWDCKEIQVLIMLSYDNFELIMSEHCEGRRALWWIKKG